MNKIFLGSQLGKEPFLSICIPTYNQPERLDLTLKSLQSQLMTGVEIVIRDDSPDMGSEEIVSRYLSSLSIRYYHGERIGIDRAVIFITEQAKGKYIWWLGDDVMAEGAVEYVLKLLTAEPQITFIWVNSCAIGGGMSSLDYGSDKFFKDNNEVLECVGDLLGYISAAIFKREILLGGTKHAERHIGTTWVTLFLVLYVLSRPGKYLYLHTPYIQGHPRPETDPHWYDPSQHTHFKIFTIDFYKVVTDSEFHGRFSKRSIKRMLANNIGAVLGTILVQRAKSYTYGMATASQKIRKIFPFYWNFPEFWLALPFLVAPSFVVRVGYKVYKFFFKNTRIRFRKTSASFLKKS